MTDAEVARAINTAFERQPTFTALQRSVITKFVSDYVAKRLDAEIAKLSDEIASLRVDMQVVSAATRGEIKLNAARHK